MNPVKPFSKIINDTFINKSILVHMYAETRKLIEV